MISVTYTILFYMDKQEEDTLTDETLLFNTDINMQMR